MKKIKYLVLEESGNDYEGVTYQELYDDSKETSISFCASNLCECPEDAIIGRGLFDACDYVDALNRGIELAKMGYDKVLIEDDEEEE